MKDIIAKTGEYQKDGDTKSNWTKIGVVLSNQHGEYMLLDPTVNLAGVLTKQNMLANERRKAGDQNARVGTSVMCSIIDKSEGGQSQPAQQSAGIDEDIPF